MIMNISLPNFTEDQDIFILLTFFRRNVSVIYFVKMLIKEKNKNNQKSSCAYHKHIHLCKSLTDSPVHIWTELFFEVWAFDHLEKRKCTNPYTHS